jgi:hypothetical protein
LRKKALASILFYHSLNAFSQGKDACIITGNVQDESRKAISGATVQLISFADSLRSKITIADKNGVFSFSGIPLAIAN